MVAERDLIRLIPILLTGGRRPFVLQGPKLDRGRPAGDSVEIIITILPNDTF